jgi:hypothetical protein
MIRIAHPRITVQLVPLLLLALCLLAFAPLINSLGFYWDDWAKLAVDPLFGPAGYWVYYAEDRPLSGWTHILFNFLLGRSPLAWHVAVLLLRWLSGVSLWLVVRQIWRGQEFLAALTSVLFTIHPVFTLQPIAVTFHQQWLQFFLYFSSLWLMLGALDRSGWRQVAWIAPSILLMAVELSVTEYFLTLECLRPILLHLALMQNINKPQHRWKHTVLHSLPYLAVIGVYLLYRLVLIRLPGEDPYRANTLYGFFSNPIETLQTWAGIFAADLYHTFVGVWLDVFSYRTMQLDNRFDLLQYACAALAGFLAWFFISRMRRDEGESSNRPDHTGWQAALLGIGAAVLGILSGWAIGRYVLENVHGSRYAMASMFGLSLALAALMDWLFTSQGRKALIAGLLVAFSTGFHLINANSYRWSWTEQLRFYWQLSWRAPHLQPQTALVLEEEPFPDQGLFSTSAAINLLYPQSPNPQGLAYWVYSLRPRYAEQEPDPRKHQFNSRFRSLAYQGPMSQSLFLYWNPSKANCLWVLTPADQLNPYVSPFSKTWLNPAATLTDLSRIQPDKAAAGYSPSGYFGQQPEKNWCYWFESADLAVQFEQYAEAARLGDQARAAGFSPARSSSNSPREWLPLIQAYARIGRWDDARDLTIQSFEQDFAFGGMLCRAWEDLVPGGSLASHANAARQSVFQSLACGR